MIATHSIKINGRWYKAGEEIRSANTISENKKTYTKTEINRMSTSDLQKLASEHGIEDAQEKSGAELKKLLIQMFGL